MELFRGVRATQVAPIREGESPNSVQVTGTGRFFVFLFCYTSLFEANPFLSQVLRTHLCEPACARYPSLPEPGAGNYDRSTTAVADSGVGQMTVAVPT